MPIEMTCRNCFKTVEIKFEPTKCCDETECECKGEYIDQVYCDTCIKLAIILDNRKELQLEKILQGARKCVCLSNQRDSRFYQIYVRRFRKRK